MEGLLEFPQFALTMEVAARFYGDFDPQPVGDRNPRKRDYNGQCGPVLSMLMGKTGKRPNFNVKITK